MTHRNTAGKMAVRLNIIRADQEPEQLLDHQGAPWPNNYFTLVWTDTDQVCLYVHDEVTKGGVLLACSNQVSPDFCITGITLDENNVLTIEQEGGCPDQSIDLSRFIQSIAEYTVVEGPPGFFTFQKDGVAIESWWQGGFSVVNEDGSITITNPDGTTVTVPAPLDPQSITLTYNSDFSVCLNVGGMTLGCWQQGDIISEDTSLGVHIATKPDGSQITWLGTDHITVASIDAAARTVTITNPDGGTVTFPYSDNVEVPPIPVINIDQVTGITTITLDGVPYVIRQTRVTRGTGSLANQHTLTANHQTTWPNTDWRETWMERIGNIVVIHSWNPADNDWDAVAIEAPENLVILNNPVIYVNAATGTANPPINSQSDLTEANAFNTFQAVKNFMTRTLTVGTVTLDCRGDFSQVGRVGPGIIEPALFKNAQTIVLRGDPADASAFIIPAGFTGAGRNTGLQCNGGDVTLRDATLFAGNTATIVADGNANFIVVAGGNLRMAGTIRVTGTYDVTRVGASLGSIFRATGGTLFFALNTKFVFGMTAGSQVGSLAAIAAGAALNVNSGVVLEILEDLTFATLNAVFYNESQGFMIFTGGPGNLIPIAHTGAGRFIAANSVNLRDLSASTFNNTMYGNRAAIIAYDFGTTVTPGGAVATMAVASVAALNNVLGP